MGKFKFRDRKEGWEALKASGENYKTRDVYSNQQFERSSIDKPQTMTSRLIITVAATVMAVLFTWFVLSLVQAGLSGFHGMLDDGPGYDGSGGAGTTVSDVSGSGTGQEGGASGGDGVVISDADEFAAIRKMDWETYRKTYYVKVGGDGTFAHTYQSLVTGEQYSMSEIYDNYFKMRDGDYVAYEQYHKHVAGEPAGNPDAGSGQDGDAASAGFDAVQKMDWSTYQKTFYTKTDAGYVNAGDGAAYSASEMYDNYMAIQNGDYVLYAKLHGSLETPAEPAVEPDGGQDMTSIAEPGAPAAQEPATAPDAGQDAPGVDSEPADARNQDAGKTPGGARGKNWFLDFSLWKVLFTLAVGLIVFSFLYVWFRKNLEAQNKLTDTGYLNQYHNDSHVQVPEEVQQAYDWFPDVGAHAPVQVSSMISHMMLMNKGIKQVRLTKRAEKDIKDGAGEVVYFKGERLVNDDGEPIVEDVPMFDEKFAHGLFDSASIPAPEDGKRTLMDVLRNRQPPPDYRIFYDARQIPYNPGDKNRDKLKGAETVADMINKYWEFPEYEPQRPGGAYVVDVAPVNTMV